MKTVIILSFCVMLSSEGLRATQYILDSSDMAPQAMPYAEAIIAKARTLAMEREKEARLIDLALRSEYEQIQQKWKKGEIAEKELRILEDAWEETWRETMRPLHEELQRLSTIVSELRTIVVTFDEDGNPVSSIDLAEYGLSMPILTPNPDEHSAGLTPYIVTFPHEEEVRERVRQ